MRDWKAALQRRLTERRLDPTLHSSVIDELSQHLDQRYQSLLAQGMSSDDAEQRVLQELDDDALERELQHTEQLTLPNAPILGDRSRSGLADSLAQDLRYAARTLRKSPGFTVVAVVTLALGIGAGTAIFTIINAVMLRSLAFTESDRLVRIWESNPERGWPQFAVSHPNFLDWRSRVTSLDSIAASTEASFSLTSNQGAEIVRASAVTADFLPVLDVTPALGRNFRPEEDRPEGETRVVMLSERFWQQRFGSDGSILGRSIALDGSNYTVIGVLPGTFNWGTGLDLLVPLAPDPARNRADHRLTVIGRLKDGTSIEQAHADLARIAATLDEQYPDSNRGWSVRLASFYEWIVPTEIRESLLILMGAVGLVLLIACGNVANLLLARGAARQREISIRVALGAERLRIIRQLLIESLLLALPAAVAGLAIAAGTTRLLVSYGPDAVPRLDEVSLDLNVLGFALAISLATTIIFGLVPAIQSARQRPADALRDVTRGTTGGAGRQRLRTALTVAEVALSVALLIGAGLLLRSFWMLQQVDPGFDVAPLMTMRVNLPQGSYPDGDARTAFYQRQVMESRDLMI